MFIRRQQILVARDKQDIIFKADVHHKITMSAKRPDKTWSRKVVKLRSWTDCHTIYSDKINPKLFVTNVWRPNAHFRTYFTYLRIIIKLTYFFWCVLHFVWIKIHIQKQTVWVTMSSPLCGQIHGASQSWKHRCNK